MKWVAVDLLNSAALYWCQKMGCGALQAADHTSVIGEGFRNFARNWEWMMQALRTASGRKMHWNSLQNLNLVQLGCENHLDLPQLGRSVHFQTNRAFNYHTSKVPAQTTTSLVRFVIILRISGEIMVVLVGWHYLCS